MKLCDFCGLKIKEIINRRFDKIEKKQSKEVINFDLCLKCNAKLGRLLKAEERRQTNKEFDIAKTWFDKKDERK